MQNLTVISICLLSVAPVGPLTSEQGRGASASLVRVEASGGRGVIRAVVELDPAALKQAGWLSGWDVRLVVEPDSGGSGYTVDSVLEPGERLATLSSETGLPPGRYTVRTEVKAKMSRLAARASTTAIVLSSTSMVGTSALASRRGPSTAMSYEPTASPRFRRTERLRIEVPVLDQSVSSSARALTRQGQVLPLTVTVSERVEGADKLAVAEVILAPLAEGDYVFEMSFAGSGRSEVVAYVFRVVP